MTTRDWLNETLMIADVERAAFLDGLALGLLIGEQSPGMAENMAGTLEQLKLIDERLQTWRDRIEAAYHYAAYRHP